MNTLTNWRNCKRLITKEEENVKSCGNWFSSFRLNMSVWFFVFLCEKTIFKLFGFWTFSNSFKTGLTGWKSMAGSFWKFSNNDQPWHSLNTITKWRVSHVLSKLTCGADVLLERVDVTSSRSLFWLAIFDLELGWTVVGGGGGGGGERREDPPLPFSSLWPSLTFWVQFSFSTQLSATV